MTHIQMTENETRIYDAADAEWEALRSELIERAREHAAEANQDCEIRTADGVVYEVVEA